MTLNSAAPGSSTRPGLYRIIGKMGDRSTNSCGRFTITLRAEKGAWRFHEDASEVATQADYDTLQKPEMFTD